jgi:hypothetical protein
VGGKGGIKPLFGSFLSSFVTAWNPRPPAGAVKWRGRAFAPIQTKTIPDFVLYHCRFRGQRIVRMDWADYLRDQATMYLQLAEQTDDPAVQNEMLELASVCEEVANNMEDHLTPG